MTTPRTRYVSRRHDPRRWLLRLVLWGVPVVVSVLTLIYAHKIVESRQRGPEVVSAADPPTKASPGATGSEPEPEFDVGRYTAEILRRNAERQTAKAREREVETLKREVERLRLQAARNAESAAAAPPKPGVDPMANPEPKGNLEPKTNPEPKANPEPMPEPKQEPEPTQQPEPEAGPESEPAPVAREPEPDPETERKRQEEARKQQEVQDLFEKAAAYREARDPAKLLEALVTLQRLRPGDPSVQLGLGEVYASIGEHFDLAKARSAFQRFLALTTAGQFEPASLHRLSPVHGKDVQELRVTVRRHLALLEKKHRLLLVTSPSTIARLVSGLEKELKERRQTITEHKALIAKYESQINAWRSSRRFDRHSKIRTLKRHIQTCRNRIAGQEAQIEFVTAELARLREADR